MTEMAIEVLQIAQQIVDRGTLGPQMGGKRAERQDAERHEDERDTDPLHERRRP